MRKLTIIFASLIISIITNGQNLTIDYIISLNPKSLSGIEESLAAKNWQLVEAIEPSDGKRGIATFAYGKRDYDDKAESFIKYFYSKFSLTSNRINIQTSKIATYNTYVNRLKALGYKLTSTKVTNGEILKIYRSSTFVIEVTIGILKDDYVTKNVYHFFICKKTDYNQNYETANIPEATTSDRAIITPYLSDTRVEANNAFDNKEYKKASSLYLQLINRNNFISDDFYYLGCSFYMLDKYQDGIKYFKKYETLENDYANTKDMIAPSYYLGHSFYMLNKYQDAIRYLKKYETLDKKDADTEFITDPSYYLGYSFYMLNKYQDAINYFKKFETLDNDDADIKHIIADCYYKLNNLTSAISYSLSAIKLDESNPDYYNSLGWYYIFDKQFDKALDFLKKGELIEGETKNETFYYIQGNLAHVYLFLGQYEKAKKIYIQYKTHIFDNNKTWNSMVTEDFKTFKQRNIYLAKGDEIIKLLNQ